MSKLLVFWLGLIFFRENTLALELIFKGNERTKESYLRQLGEKCLEDATRNQKDQKAEQELLQQCLINTRLFSEVKITTLSEKQWEIEIEERWTLIPIPYYQRQSNIQNFGLFVVESNFLGYGKTLVGGGYTGTQGYLLFLMLHDQSNLYHSWVHAIEGFYSKKDYVLYNGENSTYEQRAISHDYLLEYGYHWKYWSLIGIGSYDYKHFEAIDNNIVPNDYDDFWLGVGLRYNNTNFKFYYIDGLKGQFSLKKELARQNRTLKNYENAASWVGNLVLEWQGNLSLDHVLQLNSQIYFETKSDRRTSSKVGGQRGTRGVPPGGIWPKELYTFSIDYHIPIFYWSFGTWTLSPFTDFGSVVTVENLTPDKNYMSYGLGTYLYIKKVNLPAIGLLFGKNPVYQSTFFSVSIGRSF